MKIVIIGSQGMLGQELVNLYQDQKPIQWSRADLDITDLGAVKKRIEAEKPDVVFNATAYNDVDGAEDNRSLAMDVNGKAPGYLADAVQAVGGVLVHYSTDYVFRGDKKDGYKEDDIPDPQSMYGKSKLAGEKAVQANMDKYYIIRLSRLFGQVGGGASAKRSFVEIMIGLGEAGKEINAIDEELSSPTYAPDLAQQSRVIVDSSMSYGTYHVTNSGVCSWYDFAKEIFAIKGIDVTLNPVVGDFFTRAAPRPTYSVLLNTKFKTLRTWEEALRDFLTE